MLAVCGEAPQVGKFLQGRVPAEFQKRSEGHPHGWGVAWFGRGGPRLRREPGQALGDARFLASVRKTKSAVVLLHVRRATRGIISLENTHPFVNSAWAFAHNGTVEDAGVRVLRRGLRPAPTGQTDSEVFFRRLVEAVESEGLVAGTRAVLGKIAKAAPNSRLNFILSDGKKLVAYRHGHSLYRFRARAGRGWVEGVSSDRMGDDWSMVPPRRLLVWQRGRFLESP